jgi:hypothetical protein
MTSLTSTRLFLLLTSLSGLAVSQLHAPEEPSWSIFSPIYSIVDILLGNDVDKERAAATEAFKLNSILCTEARKYYTKNYKKPVQPNRYEEIFKALCRKKWPKQPAEFFDNKWNEALALHKLQDNDNWQEVDAHVMAFVTYLAIDGHSWHHLRRQNQVKEIIQILLRKGCIAATSIAGEERVVFVGLNREYYWAVNVWKDLYYKVEKMPIT